MILIGMFDSPFTRRVAISATLLGIPFEHRNWSVGKDFDRIREFNPLGRVPTLVLDDGECLIESAMILDWLDQQAGPERALLPASGAARRQALTFMALATGAADKGIHLVIERVFRPEEKRHAPWTDRCRVQIEGAFAELDRLCAAGGGSAWLLGDAMTQADITLACYVTYLCDAVPLGLSAYPSLQARVERCEALPVFGRFYIPFDAPVPNEAKSA
ncbi:MAG TPA: glutathione S-transferase family protein [Xanthomonadaceae bacterium]|jgi:glutathione S-transferase|nr:glutathione S-transferase family protein [Xanthomonadaceae bacterium]